MPEQTMNVTANASDSKNYRPEGNAGNRDNTGSSGKGKNKKPSELRSLGDARARAAGINPSVFSFYFINEDGDIRGVTLSASVGLEGNYSPAEVDFGPAPLNLPGDYGKNDKRTPYSGQHSLSAVYKGNISAARVTELEKIISDNARWANSKQSGERITNARWKTEQAKKELAMIDYVRRQQAMVTEAQERADAEAKAKAEAEEKARAEAEKREEAEKQREQNAVTSSVKFTAEFYKEISNQFSVKASTYAQGLADSANGKKIRGVDEAIKEFDKFKDILNKKFSLKDRTAILSALDSLCWDKISSNLYGFGKAFGLTTFIIDFYPIMAVDLPHAIITGEWRRFFVKIETLATGVGATALTAYVFSIMLGTPLGILGYALMLAIISALIDDKRVEDVNNLLGF